MKWIAPASQFVIQKISSLSQTAKDQFPAFTDNGIYQFNNNNISTIGYYPALLWKHFEFSQNEEIKKLAKSTSSKVRELLLKPNNANQKVGLPAILAGVSEYNNTYDTKLLEDLVIIGNIILSTYDPTNNLFIDRQISSESPASNRLYINNMISFSFLYWLGNITQNKTYTEFAKKGTDQYLKLFERDNGSTFNQVTMDQDYQNIQVQPGSAFSEKSTWTRGLAWSIYSLAIAFNYSNDEKYKIAAIKNTNYFLVHSFNNPLISWDFQLPADNPSQKYSYPDSSAQAIAGSAILYLSTKLEPTESKYYRELGTNLLEKLYYNSISDRSVDFNAILLHGTENFPLKKNIDTGLIWGDYFYTEGILYLSSNSKLLFL